MAPILKSDCVIQYSRKRYLINHIHVSKRMFEELNENNKVKQFWTDSD